MHLNRLKAATVLSKAQLDCVVYGGDALVFFYGLPVLLTDSLQLMVHEANLTAAGKAICSALNYSQVEVDEARDFKEVARYVPQGSTPTHAFKINKDTLLFTHNFPEQAYEKCEPLRIYIHASTVYHVNMNNSLRYSSHPKLPKNDFQCVYFLREEAYYDSILDTMFKPPSGSRHIKLLEILRSYLMNLISFTTTLSEGRIFVGQDLYAKKSRDPTSVKIHPYLLKRLACVRFDNRTYLIRAFVHGRLNGEESARERSELQGCLKLHGLAQGATKGQQRDPAPTSAVKSLTPFLVQRHGVLAVEWHPISCPPPNRIP
ncbi:hypothetical protein E1B28_006321 [Marasmius oreades]|uniref:Uncharacterized protein n=1 Tax=Marasmius oreades TaxID=181124 RepID=A0A9P7S508_9AGAR|nr:uncharacterized protein E1B28_006321 [Marasmius oreades]KAG7095591.1 hypothetical protein E1B28_006321 [Marasmius oreades]